MTKISNKCNYATVNRLVSIESSVSKRTVVSSRMRFITRAHDQFIIKEMKDRNKKENYPYLDLSLLTLRNVDRRSKGPES